MGVTDPNDRMVPLCPGGSDPICVARDADGNCRKWQCIDSSGGDDNGSGGGGGGGGGGYKIFGGEKAVTPLWSVRIFAFGKVYFENKSVGCPVLEWLWEFGDGQTSQEKNPTHTYGSAGTYTVTLNARTETGWYGNTLTFVITDAQFSNGKSVSFSYVKSGLSVFFTDTSTMDGSCRWSFGDGAYSTDTNPAHIFAAAGTYSVILTKGLVSYGLNITVSVLSGGAFEDVWTFGANANATLSPGSITSSGAGGWDCYAVSDTQLIETSTLTVTDDFIGVMHSGYMANDTQIGLDLSGSSNKDAVDFALRMVNTGTRYAQVYENGVYKTQTGDGWPAGWGIVFVKGPSGISVKYCTLDDFGNYTAFYTSLVTPSGSYKGNFNINNNGTSMNVKMKTYDSAPPEDTIPEILYFESDIKTVNPGDSITLNALFTGTLPITYDIATGDLTVTAAGTVVAAPLTIAEVISFAAVGIYTCTLTLTNAYGTATASCEIIVQPADDDDKMDDDIVLPPVASFTADAYGGAPTITIAFTDTSVGDPDGWLWNFGDGATSSSQHPSHQYNNEGTYTVTLTVSRGIWTSMAMRQIFVSSLPSDQWPPLITDIAADDQRGTVPFTVAFTCTVTDTPSYLWDFGDGTVCTLEDPSHTFETPGIYTVTLTVKNAYGTTKVSLEILVLLWGNWTDGDLSTLAYYIIDTLRHRVLVFSRAGVYLGSFGAYGTLDGNMNNPTGIAAINALKYDGKTKLR